MTKFFRKLTSQSMKYHPKQTRILIRDHESGFKTVSRRQFSWGEILPKGNGGVQRFFQAGWKSVVEYKGIKKLDWKAYKPTRNESWS